MIKNESVTLNSSEQKGRISDFLPFLRWMGHYSRDELIGDLIAGLIVAIMLVPQGMAYALLAGLPPEVGLYASIVPLIIYGLLGTSRSLAVGPVAIVSLLVATGVSPFAEPGSAEYLSLTLTLAFMVGVMQVGMGLLRIGFLVNFLSHPVLSGFTSAAAIVIGFSQLKHVLGYNVPRMEHFYEQVWYTVEHMAETNVAALAMGLLSMAVLFYFKNGIADLLRRLGLAEALVLPLSKIGPLVVVLIGTLAVWGGGLDTRMSIKIVGAVPGGLPGLTMPLFDPSAWQQLLPTALTISFVGYMESISVAKSLAAKRRQKVDANQELVALGAANLGAMLTGGYPVTGGFSRSIVNFAAGAKTGLASIITALLVAFTLLFLTPLFYFLPKAVLAAIILVAVTGLLDTHTLLHAWQYNKADAVSLIVTFLAVLAIGIENGILVGVASSILLFLWRTSKPHVATIGRMGDSEIYRNVLRHDVQTWPNVVNVRVDQSLYFANTKFLEDTVLNIVADQPSVKHVVLAGTSINHIDASALETLEQLHEKLHDSGVQMHLAAFKGPVMDKLREIGFVEEVGEQHFHLSTHEAMKALGCVPDEKALLAHHIPTITSAKLHTELKSNMPPLLIDVRSPKEFANDGHIAGAWLLPLSTLSEHTNTLPTDRSIVLVCRYGARSGVACEMLQKEGFDKVNNLKGGMLGWRRAGLPTR
ncbi:MAG: sulfate permease [Ardenticatenaceae bacterium]